MPANSTNRYNIDLPLHLCHILSTAVEFEMSERVVQPVLRCERCRKLFDKGKLISYCFPILSLYLQRRVVESALRRHGYYCRSRGAGSVTRTRSCVPCARGKTRCDNSRPECSRCTAKAIECRYPANTTPKLKESRTQHSDEVPTEGRLMLPSLVAGSPFAENHPEASNDGGMTFDSALVMSEPDFTSFEGQHIDWDDLDMNFPKFVNPQTNDEIVQCASTGSPSIVCRPTPSINQTIQVQQSVFSPAISIPAVPMIHTLRSLVQRPRRETGAQKIANLIHNTLKSYPLMILRHNTVPPFIHPRLLSFDVENNDMEPLNNCLSLMRMISGGNQGSRKLFWKNVRLECENLRENVS